MLTNITLENLPSYELGEERGEKRGIAIGEKRGEKRGIVSGITIGEEQGIVIGVESVVINLFDILDDEAIAQRTGLSLERIKQLREAHQPSH